MIDLSYIIPDNKARNMKDRTEERKNRFNGESEYYYHNMCTTEQRPLTESQYNDDNYTLNT